MKIAHYRRTLLVPRLSGLVLLAGLAATAISGPAHSDDEDAARRSRRAATATAEEPDGDKDLLRAQDDQPTTPDEVGQPASGSDTAPGYKPKRDIVLDDPDLTEALRGLERDKEAITTAFQRRTAARKQLDAVQAKYEAGTATLDALLAAQRQWADARLGYVNQVVEFGRHGSAIDGAVKRWMREQFSSQDAAPPKLVEVAEGDSSAAPTIRYHGKAYRIEGDDHWMWQYPEEQFPTILKLWIVQEGRDVSLKLWRKIHAERAADKKKVSADDEMHVREQYYLFRGQFEKHLASLSKPHVD
ncbi:MAG TPA: TolC family protein [Pirellulales bacterium]|nr:TolC family protein [Pirellulales bacterium]